MCTTKIFHKYLSVNSDTLSQNLCGFVGTWWLDNQRANPYSDIYRRVLNIVIQLLVLITFILRGEIGGNARVDCYLASSHSY